MGDHDDRRIKTFEDEERFQPGTARAPAMSCEEIRQFLKAIHFDTGTEDDVQKVGDFLEHMRVCPQCRALLDKCSHEDGSPNRDIPWEEDD